MKVLFLVRHAKSSWKNSSLSDFDRPLNNRGKHDAPFMGIKLKDMGIKPSLILSSPAKRAKKTAKAIAKALGFSKKDIVLKSKIYEASSAELLAILKKQDSDLESIMLVGHNPELTALSNFLSNEFIGNIPTTGISCIRFNTDDWHELAAHSGKQSFFDYPKRYLK